jgi:eukaryotic-like serine/threonine-protein kinase
VDIPARLGKYDIESVLGKGAMGVVYKAHDPLIDRAVAIKTVRKDTIDADVAAQFMARFRNEARAAGRLLHPNIVAIYEYGEDDGVAYIAMEYVDGTGLREYLNRKARFDFAQLAAIMSQLLQALEFAHARGVVHRDIKPANMILTHDGTLKVADFGIARIDTSNLTMAGMVMGTPSYMAPEQCRGEPSDHRADLFSAGVVFYELLTGEKPFAGSVESITYQICHQEPKPPSQISALVLPPAVDALISTALAKSPEQRFQNARAFHHALREAVGSSREGATQLDATVLNLAQVELQSPTLAWDDSVLSTVERKLAHYVGPLSRMLVRRAATQTHGLSELCALLATHIGDAQSRDQFVAEMEKSGAHVTTGSRAPLTSPTAASASVRAASQPSSTRRGETARSGEASAPGASAPLDQAFIDHITTRLAAYLGPIAKVVARKAAQQARTRQEFVQIVASHIGTQDRLAFLRETGFTS